uniref:Retrovirus-related Pol polyprotein from transposon TNT 1-94 n=1 Tax=Tanacetum cinerariifolium TaxID=118510 RepID=A0A6L2NKF2_TANCI|nr:retrovirus-related Pol polyprotein from transposon TNT 1-94 [Tanacetum cinerariifolium]
MKNYKNVSQYIRDQLDAEAEAVQIILTRINNDIYSTVDACLNACEMWKAIERLKQSESINVQDLETNLYWEFEKFTSRDGESLESYYSRFYKIMNELVRNQCDVTNHQVNFQFLLQLQQEWQSFVTLVKQSQELKIVSYHKLYDILKKHKNEVNEIRVERIAHDEISKDKDIDKLMVLISLSFKKIYKPTNNNLKTSSNTSKANQDNSSRINRGTGYDNQRIANVTGARENVDTAENSGPIFDVEPLHEVQNNDDHYNVFANNGEHPVQPEYINDTYLEEQGDTNITIDSLYLSTNGETVDQYDDYLVNERNLLDSLIEKQKYEIDDSKNRNEFLETSNKALVDKLKGIIPTTSASRPQLKSNQLEDRVMHNNSQQKIEDHRGKFKFSNNKTSVTTCNDSLDAMTSNVNFVCATCGKCVLNANHDLCVLHYINGVNSRTKQLIDVSISTKEPKRNVNQSAATSHKKTILGYGDLVQGTITIKRVYYVEELNHNLFSVGQFCDADLEVTFWKSTCYICDLKGNNLLTGYRGIQHQTSVARTPEQNSVVKRQNRTLVEAARTMLRAAKLHLYFCAEAIATTCFTQNCSLVILQHEKTPYHIINGQKPSIKFFHIFGSLCYIVSDGENLNKIKEKAETVTTSNELVLLFSPMFDELLNETATIVSKTSAVNADDAPDKRQQQNTTQSTTTTVAADIPPLNIQTTRVTTNQAPTQARMYSPWIETRYCLIYPWLSMHVFTMDLNN